MLAHDCGFVGFAPARDPDLQGRLVGVAILFRHQEQDCGRERGIDPVAVDVGDRLVGGLQQLPAGKDLLRRPGNECRGGS